MVLPPNAPFLSSFNQKWKKKHFTDWLAELANQGFGLSKDVILKSVKWPLKDNKRCGEWYLEKRGSRKILAGSQNLRSVFEKSWSLVFARFVFTFFESRNLGSDF